MLTNESERIGKGRQGFAIPGRLSNRKRLAIQQVMSKDGNARKESQQGRSGAQNSQIRPLALGLDAQMITHLMKGDFDRPAQDKPLHDLGSLCILIGAKQGHWLILSLWIANEDEAGSRQEEQEIDTTELCQWRFPSLGWFPHTRTACVSSTAWWDQ